MKNKSDNCKITVKKKQISSVFIDFIPKMRADSQKNLRKNLRDFKFVRMLLNAILERFLRSLLFNPFVPNFF